MSAATGTDLLDQLVTRLDEDGTRCTNPTDRAEQVAVRNMLTAAAANLRAGRRGPLESAVLEFAQLGAAYFAEDTR